MDFQQAIETAKILQAKNPDIKYGIGNCNACDSYEVMLKEEQYDKPYCRSCSFWNRGYVEYLND